MVRRTVMCRGGSDSAPRSLVAVLGVVLVATLTAGCPQTGPDPKGPKDSPEMQVSAAEFILEGLHAHKKIGRNEERVFTAGEKQPKPAEKPMFEREEPGFGRKRSFN